MSYSSAAAEQGHAPSTLTRDVSVDTPPEVSSAQSPKSRERPLWLRLSRFKSFSFKELKTLRSCYKDNKILANKENVLLKP